MCKPIFSAYHVKKRWQKKRREILNVLHRFSVGYIKVNIKRDWGKERNIMIQKCVEAARHSDGNPRHARISAQTLVLDFSVERSLC